jgi:hypothetical protein
MSNASRLREILIEIQQTRRDPKQIRSAYTVERFSCLERRWAGGFPPPMNAHRVTQNPPEPFKIPALGDRTIQRLKSLQFSLSSISEKFGCLSQETFAMNFESTDWRTTCKASRFTLKRWRYCGHS